MRFRLMACAAAAIAASAPAARALVQNGFGYSLEVVDSRDTRFNFGSPGLVSDNSGFLRVELTNERQKRASFGVFPPASTDPIADTNVAVQASGQGSFGVLRAAAYIRYSLATNDLGLLL